MQVLVENAGVIQLVRTDKPVTIETDVTLSQPSKVIVGTFDGSIQVVNITGDPKRTMVKFNGKSLL